MRRLILILSFFTISVSYSYSQTEHLPQVAWRTILKNVVMVNDSTYTVEVDPIDYNEPGAIQRIIGNYLKDFVGHTYKIVDSTSTAVTVVDVFQSGVGPQTDRAGIVYKSVGDGISPYLAPVYYNYLDKSAFDYSRSIELSVLWNSGAAYIKDSANILWWKDTLSHIATKYDLDTLDFIREEIDGSITNELNTSITWDEPTNIISIIDAGGSKSTQITGFAKSTDISNVVTASTVFGNDNRLLRSDGTGRGSQSSGITVDDSNNITGAVNISGSTLQSTVATGTAPIIVSSTTLVNNLNADLLDGYHASSFIQNHSVTNNYLLKSNGLGGISQSVIFDNGTNVGIGTTNPEYRLDVNGYGRINGVTITSNGAKRVFSTHSKSGLLRLQGGIVTDTNTGNIEIEGSTYQPNSPQIRFNTNNSQIMVIHSSGNVGIGTTNPLEKLDVNGNIKSSSLSGVGTRLVTASSSGVLGSIDYNYINLNSFSSGTATSGQVPTANGSGGITWANQSGSGGYWSQSSGAIYPTTITDEVRIGSTTDLGSQKLQVDANSVFRLRNVNTTQSIDFITAVTGTQPYFRLEHDGNNGLQIAGYKDSYWSSIFSIKYPSFVSYFDDAIKLGTTSLEEAGVMRYNGTNFQGYNGTTWVNLDGSGTSQWTNDTYGINYLSNIGVGTTSTSGIKLSAYQNGTGYVASLVNQSSSGSGLWLSGGGDATYSLEVNNYAGTRRFGILGSGKIFSYGLTNSTSSNVLYYNSSTGEISYGAATGGTSQWVNDTYGINYTSGNVSVGAASSSSVKFKSSLNTADAYAGSFENSNASGNGLYIRGGYTNRYALAVDDYNTADLFSIMGDGKIYANKLTNSSTSYTLYYNTSTKEISYALAPSGGGGDYWSKSSGVIFPTTTTDKLVVGKTTSSGEAMFEVQGKSAFSDEISVGTRLWMGGGSVVLNNVPGQLLLSTNMGTENDIALSVRSSVYNPSGSLFRVRGNGYIDIAFNDNSPTVYTASSGVLRAGSNGKLYWKTISGGEYDLTATGSGGGTPGGSINSIQYNNSGAFGGFGNVGTYTISLGKPLELENRLNHPSATGQGIVTYDYIEDRVYVGTYGAQMPINRQKTQTPTIATNMTLDWRNGANMSITLTTNVALSIQNIPDGESGTILVKQDATGNRNISFTVWADSGLNSLTQTKIGSITDINKVSNKYSTITYKRFAGVVTLVYGREN